MKTTFVCLSLLVLTTPLLADFSSKEWKKIKQAVAGDIDSLVGETVNEGENEAYVKTTGKEKTPVMTCRNKSLPERELEIILCEVTFRVRPYESEWTERSCNLTYLLHVNSKFPTLTRGQDSIFDRCVENLSEGE